ncbi:unnamed protein product [Ambrosiozyma monospora]|uniref:Unnamed protein product n=1 Tax=Ambrosiozyma monospora TaxID=43982 RepID=A0ACB5SR17_AMBMO|nr:unnamed protein product [Ambrosiozyma monospora]
MVLTPCCQFEPTEDKRCCLRRSIGETVYDNGSQFVGILISKIKVKKENPLKDPQPSKPSNSTTLGTFDTIDFTDSDENFSSSKPGTQLLTPSITPNLSHKAALRTNRPMPMQVPGLEPYLDPPPSHLEKLKDFYLNGMKVGTALIIRINFLHRRNSSAQWKTSKKNPTLLEFYPNLINTSIIYINTVGLPPANTFLSGPTEERRKKKLEEESQKLIIKLTTTTFSYTTNLTFQLEHIDYENTNDILPPSDFKTILTKSPAAFDQANVQELCPSQICFLIKLPNPRCVKPF